jgi:cysteine desulfurase
MRFTFLRKLIYADWAATTPLRKEVEKAMRRARKNWANPNAIYKEGVEAKKALELERVKTARILGVKPEEIYFTSGGTEANCTIIQGVLRTKLEKGVKDVHVVTTLIEHSSVLETLKLFGQHGVKVTYVKPDKNGIVSADEVLKAITPATALVTVMYANNEIGTIQPVSKIGAGIRKLRAEGLSEFPAFHVDASQAPLWLSCEMEGLRADTITLDAHKMQGPKGVGALVVRRHVSFEPLMIGGGQERGQRPTTESLELVSGFSKALELSQAERQERTKKTEVMQKYFFDRIQKVIPGAIINGSLEKRLPNNVNISLPNISDPEMAVLKLDKEGISCSTKSSCLKGEENSYVVASLGGEPWRARNTLRFSFSPDIKKSDIDHILLSLSKC